MAELARIAALRKKQLLQAIARAAQKAEDETARAIANAERHAQQVKQREQAARMAKERKKHAHDLWSVEAKLKSKLGAAGLQWLEDYIEEEVKKDFQAELKKAREQHLIRARRT